MSYPKPHSGFTLIELLVTLSVLSIMLGIAVPSFQDTLDKRRLKGAAEQLYADLQLSRFEAIKSNKQIAVSFKNLGTDTAWCYGMDDDLSNACDCTAVTSNCTVSTAPKLFTSSGFRGVSMTATSLGSNNLCVDPQRGKFSSGTISATSCSATTAGTVNIETTALGRLRLCSPAGTDHIEDYGTC